jgi:hypothetical protein
MVLLLAVTQWHFPVPVEAIPHLQIRAGVVVALVRPVQAAQEIMGMQHRLRLVALVVQQSLVVALVAQVATLARMVMPEQHRAVEVAAVALMLTDVSGALVKYVSRTQQERPESFNHLHRQQLPTHLVQLFQQVPFSQAREMVISIIQVRLFCQQQQRRKLLTVQVPLLSQDVLPR